MLPFDVLGTGADSKRLVRYTDSPASEAVPACQDVSDLLCSSQCRLPDLLLERSPQDEVPCGLCRTHFCRGLTLTCLRVELWFDRAQQNLIVKSKVFLPVLDPVPTVDTRKCLQSVFHQDFDTGQKFYTADK